MLSPSIQTPGVLSFQLEDKPRSFAGSNEWIGSVEVMMVIDKICDVPCKILHARKGKDLENLFDQVLKHLNERCCPIMMGGDLDCSSKGIFGACKTASDDKYFLILDPHFVKNKAGPETPEHLIEAGWAKWVKLKDFVESSFYNLCLPQTMVLCK